LAEQVIRKVYDDDATLHVMAHFTKLKEYLLL